MTCYSTFIDARDLAALEGEVADMVAFDAYLHDRLCDCSIEGLKAWEYGRLMAFLGDLGGLTVLDVGPGDSTFCLYLAHRGAQVTTIDYPQPMAPDKEGLRARCRSSGVATTCGTMLRLPFRDGAFDVVTCTSTIEHLDMTPAWEPIPYQAFIAATREALAEMCRVVAEGGYLYLTTDAYIPERQKTDGWPMGAVYPGIGAAYRLEDIEGLFVATVEGAGLHLVGGHDYRPALLDDPQRANYRGRYFTTLCLLAQRRGEADVYA